MARPTVWMTMASAATAGVLVLAFPGWSRAAIGLGAGGPLAGALATWVLVARTHTRAPERVRGLMLKLFAAKIAFFAALVITAAVLLADGLRAFAWSLAGQYIMLHFMEAYFLHRLFSPPARGRAQREGGAGPRLHAD